MLQQSEKHVTQECLVRDECEKTYKENAFLVNACLPKKNNHGDAFSVNTHLQKKNKGGGDQVNHKNNSWQQGVGVLTP